MGLATGSGRLGLFSRAHCLLLPALQAQGLWGSTWAGWTRFPPLPPFPLPPKQGPAAQHHSICLHLPGPSQAPPGRGSLASCAGQHRAHPGLWLALTRPPVSLSPSSGTVSAAGLSPAIAAPPATAALKPLCPWHCEAGAAFGSLSPEGAKASTCCATWLFWGVALRPWEQAGARGRCPAWHSRCHGLQHSLPGCALPSSPCALWGCPHWSHARVKAQLSSPSVPTGKRGWGERGVLPLLPAALHGAAAQRGALHPHHCGREEVSGGPLPRSASPGSRTMCRVGGGRSPTVWGRM